MSEVLAAFMEERNILWGELVGGLLMVGCSIALVISLWHTLEHVPEPAGMLRSFHQWLKPEGQVLVQVPDVARNPYDLGVVDHVSHFTNATLRFCARSAGFEIAADGHSWTHNCLTFLLGSPALIREPAPVAKPGVAAGDPFERGFHREMLVGAVRDGPTVCGVAGIEAQPGMVCLLQLLKPEVWCAVLGGG